MNVTGLWEVISAQTMDPKTFEMSWKPKADVDLASADDFIAMAYNTLFDFKEDGTLGMMMQGPPVEAVPKDELDKAVEAGEAFVEDGKVYVVQKKAWKEEDGIILINTGETGEVLGEAINPWKEAVEEGNTLIVMEMYQICRIGETPASVKKKEVKTLTDEMKAAVGTYKGLYTKFVGDDTKKEEPFSLEFKEDGTGLSKRNNLEIKVPDWNVEGGKVTMTEKFLGTIDYTGTLDGKSLVLYNDDPEKPLTCMYVYEKE